MALLGTFALLLALALSVYSFGAGFCALVPSDVLTWSWWRKNMRPRFGVGLVAQVSGTIFISISALAAVAVAVAYIVRAVNSLFVRGQTDRERLAETARRAGIATFGAVVLAAVVLVTAAFQNDFSIAYIFHHSNRALPAPYKFATLWSGQEGSLLFWSLLLGGYGFILRLRYKTDPRLFAYASVVIAAVQVFFFALLNFAANPFGLIEGPLRADGAGLNPLLQYPEMVIHPPMLYLGYVGFTVPFAFALGALIMRYPGEKWIRITRRWTMVTWGFLTCGVFLGSHWAYSVLGWGGYWGWDPVENASLMPWLVGTAFLHSVMMQEKRGMLKVWNMWLVFGTFWLAILGTFLTRSGMINSVHAFAQSSIGSWFAWLLGISFAVFLFFFIKNKDHLKSEHKLESLISRESSFLFNNLLFLLLTLDVLWGTWFPKISELVQGNKVTVGGPFYNRVAIPVALLLLVLTAIGPLLAWRKTSFESLKRNFLWPTVAAVAVALFIMLTPQSWGSIFGLKPWVDISYFYSLMTIFLSTLVASTVISEFYRGGRVISEKTGQGMFASMVQLTHRNTRRYGGYIVHFGVVLAMIGFSGSSLNQEKEMEMGYGDKMTIGSYELICRSYTQDDNPNQFMEWAIIDVYQHGKKIDTMMPERILYKASSQPSTKPDIDQGFKEDLYLVYEGQNDKGQPVIKAHLNPLVIWIWIGAWVMVIGTGLALVESAPATVTVRVPKLVEHAPPHAEPVATGD